MHPGKGPSDVLIGRACHLTSITLRTIPGNCPKTRAVQDIKGSRVIHKNFGKFGEKVGYGISYTV